jgi:UDP-N-acetylmuramoyl-tripeptide--D-alanyl-D-alanine ligase
MRLTTEFIARALSDARIEQSADLSGASFSVDSRTLKKGDVFVALSGATTDGHNFVAEAVRKGAGALFLEFDKKECLRPCDQKLVADMPIIWVNNTLKSLIDLATTWRTQFTYPILGITGSIGKTSTKELLASIVQRAGKKCLMSHGNQNTAIGSALNILRMSQDYDCAIFELGISKRGEMEKIVHIIKPTIGIITYIGHSHMEGLGSLADIANEKRKLFNYFKEDNIGIINGDQPFLVPISYPHPIVKFGLKTTNQVQARKVIMRDSRAHFILKLYGKKYTVDLPYNHAGMINNVLASIAAAYILRIPDAVILEGIKDITCVEGRFEIRAMKQGSSTVINDAYNASPESMKAALLAFDKIEVVGKKIAVLGDMLELGLNSAFWHRQLGRFLRKVPTIRHVILVGKEVEWTKKTVPFGVSVTLVATWQEAQKIALDMVGDHGCMLVKGSQRMGLRNLVDYLT